MILVGISGNIASGKSTLINYLKDLNYFTISYDYEVEKLYKDVVFINKIKKKFNLDVFDKDIMREFLLKDNIKFDKITRLIVKKVNKRVAKIIIKGLFQRKKYVFIEIPLLFEKGYEKYLDFTILVIASSGFYKKNLKSKNFNKEQLQEIQKKQIVNSLKNADFRIENKSTLKEFYDKADKVCDIIFKKNFSFKFIKFILKWS